MANRESKKNTSQKYRLAGMGMELAGAVGGGCLLGWWIDREFGTRYGLIICACIGIVGGLYNFIKQALRAVQQEQSRIDEQRDDMDDAR